MRAKPPTVLVSRAFLDTFREVDKKHDGDFGVIVRSFFGSGPRAKPNVCSA